ncbi:MAG TPA: hypothetical protein H9673_03095 [Candidatus Adamsella sp.]|nr:hypothetical protein [Candidatus Adamsella sp.]
MISVGNVNSRTFGSSFISVTTTKNVYGNTCDSKKLINTDVIDYIKPSAVVGSDSDDEDDRNAVIAYKNGGNDTLKETYGDMKQKLDIVG